jgi:hypothetical protein
MNPHDTFRTTSPFSQSPLVVFDGIADRVGPDAAQLALVGIARVAVEYDGCFDFATVQSAVYLNERGHVFEPEVSVALRQGLQTFFREWLELQRPGWANAEGSSGELAWDLKTDRLEHRHSWRHIELGSTELQRGE